MFRRRTDIFVFLCLAAIVALPASILAHHDAIPDPAPRETKEKLKPLPHLERDAVTVSGISSGGFFAHQFHIAFSSLVNGVGVIAGGPYGCVENIRNPYPPWLRLDRASAAVFVCTHTYGDRYLGLRPAPPKISDLIALIAEAHREGTIDDPANLADDRVFVFHGSKDDVVPAAITALVQELYAKLGVEAAALRLEEETASHGLPVAAFPEESRFPRRNCSEHMPPFVIECGFDAAERLLRHLYGAAFKATPADAHAGGTLLPFDQTEFVDRAEKRASMSGVGYVYVPKQCLTQSCRLHVAFHGCRQEVDNRGSDRAHDDFVRDGGYNRWAAANDIVVLYPQLTSMPAFNPNACWDFWGYSGAQYLNRNGTQMRAVKVMVDRLLGR
ncbi:MAG: hypothetical protein IT539_00860 [Bradyrhizobiaceae bacterium]|nr:hypothetical protein [Bradyrhizobiaceae bacterium]